MHRIAATFPVLSGVRVRANSAQIGDFAFTWNPRSPMFYRQFCQNTEFDLSASSASQSSEAAQRYASALFDLASKAGDLSGVHTAFEGFITASQDNEDLSRLMASPLYTREAKTAALTEIARKADMPDLLVRFLGTMAENGRASDIPGAQAAFDALYAAQRGVQRAVVRTAKPMTTDQRSRLEGIVAKAIGSDVEMSEEVDESLIGGIQLLIGSTLVDASLKAKLDRMNTAMKGA